MKTAFIIFSLVIVCSILLLFIVGIFSKSGKASGLVEGSLSKCPDTPNCVCSEQENDAKHAIAPIPLPQEITFDPLPIFKDVVREMGGTVQAESNNYLAAIFSSAIFGFVDDLEVRIDSAQQVVHIRSASRIGYGDLDVNRKRVELLKNLYSQKASEANQSRKTTQGNGGMSFDVISK